MVLDELETFIYTLRRRGLSHFLRKVAHARNATGVFHWMSPGIPPKGRHWNDLSRVPKYPCKTDLSIARTFCSSLCSDGSQRRPPRPIEKDVLAFGKTLLTSSIP